MSVQRYYAPPESGPWKHPEGWWMKYADHARIVAEMEARWVEIARQDRMAAHQRGAQEAERQHAKALADMEQAHAAALADANLRWDAEVTRALDEGEKIGRLYGSTPRTLTADDPEPAVGSIVMDRIGDPWRAFIGVGGVQVWASAGDIRSASWVNLHRIVGPVRLLHDGEDR